MWYSNNVEALQLNRIILPSWIYHSTTWVKFNNSINFDELEVKFKLK